MDIGEKITVGGAMIGAAAGLAFGLDSAFSSPEYLQEVATYQYLPLVKGLMGFTMIGFAGGGLVGKVVGTAIEYFK